MRDIKFRAWDKYAKEWLFGYERPNLGGFSMFGEVMVMSEWSSAAWSHAQGKLDIELMQFTGLKDKNGVEIYEGDIAAYETSQSITNGVVEYGNGLYAWVHAGIWFHMWDMHLDSIEVIGNIYENPKLLEKSNDQQV